MMRTLKLLGRQALAIACSAVLMSACDKSATGIDAGPVQLTLSAPAQVRAGDSIPLSFTVRNVSGATATFAVYAPGFGAFNPVVRDGSGAIVWEFPTGLITGTSGRIELAAGDSATWVLPWSGRMDDGAVLATGTYTIEAYLWSPSRDTLATAPVQKLIVTPRM